MEKKLTPIKLDSYQPLREVVCETLRDAIRKGVLAPGERLMEIQLDAESVILCISTEGATDVANYRRIMWEGAWSWK